LADVGLCIANWSISGAARDVVGTGVVNTTWLADIPVPLSCAVLALSLLSNTSLTNTGQTFIAVFICLTFIGNNFTGVSVRVAEVSNLTVIIILAATCVTVLMADRLRVGTVQAIVVATLATSISSSTVSPTEGTVIIQSVAELVPAITERVVITLWLTGVSVRVAEVSHITVSISLATTGVAVQVADRLGVGTVQAVIVATLATSILGSTVSPTEGTVIISRVADLVPSSTE